MTLAFCSLQTGFAFLLKSMGMKNLLAGGHKEVNCKSNAPVNEFWMISEAFQTDAKVMLSSDSKGSPE